MLDDRQKKLLEAITTNDFEQVESRIHPGEYHRLFTDIVAVDPNFTINEWQGITGNFTPLFVAVYHQHYMSIKRLLKHDCNPDALIIVHIVDEDQKLILDFHGSVFDYAVEHCDSDTMLALFIDQPLHTIYQNNIPPLGILSLIANPVYMLALCHNEFRAAAKFFELDNITSVELNEQIYFLDKIGTPLQIAAANQSPEQLEWLLQRGAEVNVTTQLQGLIARESLHPVLHYFPKFIYDNFPNGTWLDLKSLPLHISCVLNDTKSGALLQQHGAVLLGMFDDCAKNYVSWQSAIDMQNEKAGTLYNQPQEHKEGSIVPYILAMLLLLFIMAVMYYSRRPAKNDKLMELRFHRKNSSDGVAPPRRLSILDVLKNNAIRVLESSDDSDNDLENAPLLSQSLTQ
jgi:hypothetical protein